MSTSVIPYLVDLHFGDESPNQMIVNNDQILEEHCGQQNENHEQQNQFITEHDLKEQKRLREIERHDRETKPTNANVSSVGRSERTHADLIKINLLNALRLK